MALFQLALVGAAGYVLYRYLKRSRPVARGTRLHDGLAATFRTREAADLAVEHLVQEYHVDRAAIFAEPVDERNSSGLEISGGDAASGDPGSRARRDSALNGAIRVTVAAGRHEIGLLRRTLQEAGAVEVQAL